MLYSTLAMYYTTYTAMSKPFLCSAGHTYIRARVASAPPVHAHSRGSRSTSGDTGEGELRTVSIEVTVHSECDIVMSPESMTRTHYINRTDVSMGICMCCSTHEAWSLAILLIEYYVILIPPPLP